MNFFYWVLLSIGVPVAIPAFVCILALPSHGRGAVKEMIADTVRDGQLYWTSIALSAAAIYESVVAIHKAKHGNSLLEFAIIFFCFIAFSCSTIVAMSSIQNYHERKIQKDKAKMVKLQSSGFVSFSIWITSVITVFYTILHVYID